MAWSADAIGSRVASTLQRSRGVHVLRRGMAGVAVYNTELVRVLAGNVAPAASAFDRRLHSREREIALTRGRRTYAITHKAR